MSGSVPGLTAFVDESEPDRRFDPDSYMLAAALCPQDEADPARAVLAALRMRGQKKLHWRDEQAARRAALVEAVAALPLTHVVVVRDGRPGEASERRRRHCLERMVFELAARGVDQEVFESRGRADDRRDRAMLDALRAKKQAPAGFRIEHLPGPADALLWAADIVCGAVSRYRTGQVGYFEILAARLVIEIVTIKAPT